MNTVKGLYRASFYFSIQGKEYSVEYFHYDKAKFFTETIYRLPEGQAISKKEIDYPVPSAGTALQTLADLLQKQD